MTCLDSYTDLTARPGMKMTFSLVLLELEFCFSIDLPSNSLQIWRSKDLQNEVLAKYKNDNRPAKVFRNLNKAVSRNHVYVWC